MAITDLSDDQLVSFEENYRRAGKIEGGKYSLREILLEKLRRKPSVFGTRAVASKIVELARTSSDGLVTYGQLWAAFRPGAPWEGHNCLRVVADSLGRVIHYCVTNHLPIVTVLVVRAEGRRLSQKAVMNIYNECRSLGVEVGLDPNAFLARQLELSRALRPEQLPLEEEPRHG